MVSLCVLACLAARGRVVSERAVGRLLFIPERPPGSALLGHGRLRDEERAAGSFVPLMSQRLLLLLRLPSLSSRLNFLQIRSRCSVLAAAAAEDSCEVRWRAVQQRWLPLPWSLLESVVPFRG